ncbi:hypothetical protein [Candidatus Vesicomyidisocius calyptogenae]|uniref:hypothetical protein n=1 Tax=Vesicomyosocius okutanii subsp. Calyptogena okutanii (strain HA) TaxID=412965 RepID=UPI0002DFFFA9|nr:hypothetical protein [Candidatus Vesicomyosocius okutanii]
MLDNLKDTIKNLWFLNLGEEAIYINNNVVRVRVRVRASILLIVPTYIIFTFWNDRIIY